MHRSTTLLAALCLGAVVLAAPGDEETPATIAPPFDVAKLDMQDIAEAQVKAMQPGEEHEHLGFFVGEWTTSGKIFHAGPGAPPMEITGEATIGWVLGKRFLHEHTKGSFAGMPAEAHRYIGFDTNANRYEMSSMSTLSTAMTRATGLASMDGEAIIFYGPLDEPGLDLRARTVKYVFRMTGADSFAVEVYDPHIGETNNMVLEVNYERK